MTRRIVTRLTVRSGKLRKPRRLAMVSDLHNTDWKDLMPTLAEAEAILIVGDMVDRHRFEAWENALAFLSAAQACRPVYYSIGNHERKAANIEKYWAEVPRTGVTVLDNQVLRLAPDLVLGGFSSQARTEAFDAGVVDRLTREEGFRLLLCHHPEYYKPYIRGHAIDLTLSGHAHGGQIRLFGQGLYAPGQGFFPRYTSGFYDHKHLLVGRGLFGARDLVPRLWNPCELILLDLLPEDDSHAAE